MRVIGLSSTSLEKSGFARLAIFDNAATVCIISISLILGFQWMAGAFGNEFGAHPDEASHFLTGLVVKDYLMTFPYTNPMTYAENYYQHYPKIGFGHWPPMFYAVQTAWTTLFTPERFSLMLFMALLTAAISFILYRVVREEFGSKAGIAVALFFIVMPIAQESYGMLMADILVTLFCLGAILCFAKYLDTEKTSMAIWFGVLASLAILTKGNGLSLALFPPIAVILSRKYYLVKRLSFWTPALIVLLTCGPWYWATRKFWSSGPPEQESLLFIIRNFVWQLKNINKATGTVFIVLILIGLFAKLIKSVKEGTLKELWPVAGAWLMSVLVFHSVIPGTHDDRHLLSAFPAILMFVAAGVAWLATNVKVPMLNVQQRVYLFGVIALVAFAVQTFAIQKKVNNGFGTVAKDIVSQLGHQKVSLLIASDSLGEGMFITEIARSESRPGSRILRASKLLAEISWSGDNYRIRYDNINDVSDLLTEKKVEIVVMGDWLYRSDLERRDHYYQLNELMDCFTEDWEQIGSYPRLHFGDTGKIRVYRRVKGKKS